MATTAVPNFFEHVPNLSLVNTLRLILFFGISNLLFSHLPTLPTDKQAVVTQTLKIHNSGLDRLGAAFFEHSPPLFGFQSILWEPLG